MLKTDDVNLVCEAFLETSIERSRAAVAQSVERPSKVPVWHNSTVGWDQERDMSSISLIALRHMVV